METRRDYLGSCNWAAMDTDILCSIFTRLSYVDLIRVNSTCWGWSAAVDLFKSYSPTSSFEEMPWLICTPLEEEEVPAVGEKNGRFINVEEKKIYPFNDLAAKKIYGGSCYCVGSLDDWLVCLDKQGTPYLLNPFTAHRIDLPRMDLSLGVQMTNKLGKRRRAIKTVDRVYFVSKAVLSSSPSNDNKYYLVMIYGVASNLACCTDGDTSWTKLVGEDYNDITFHENQLYGFYGGGFPQYNQLIIWDMNQDGLNLVKKIDIVDEELRSGLQLSQPCLKQFYLVESQGNLLVVRKISKKIRFSRYEEVFDINNWEARFNIFKLDMEQKLWRGVESLCGFALFLGTNQSISVNTRNCKILKQDTIYFTTELLDRSGVFSLKDNCVDWTDWLDGTKRENQRSPPTWVFPRVK